jgi:hypothetical protein
MSEFYRYFKENMEGLGLPAPVTLFSSAQAAVGNHWLASVLYRCPAIHRQSGAGKRLARYGAVSR